MKRRSFHFVGIGGIGMSAVARILLDMGHEVSGSDLDSGRIICSLRAAGCRIYKGHRASSVSKGTDVVVYSSSISSDNPEIIRARDLNIRVAHRAEILAEILNAKKGIAVTGTHGKTTTTSLISVMLKKCGLNPTVMIGGEVDLFNGNAELGSGPFAVAEADESDSSFLHLKPLYSVIMNIEMEHLDHFKGMDEIKTSYRSFAGNTKRGGIVFYNIDDGNVRETLKGLKGKRASFGFSKSSDIYPIDIRLEGFETSFRCVYRGKILGRIEMAIPGRHNVLNGLAAVLVGLNMGLDFNQIALALKGFKGAKRRFQLRGDASGVMLIEDYAHHPTEIRAVLKTCRNWPDRRVVAIFQPHRYTRTAALADEFGRAFEDADKLVLTDIYAASEKPIKGVSVNMIYDKVKASGMDDAVIIKKDEIPDYIMKMKSAGDMIVVMGAGDIKETADELAFRMEREDMVNRSTCAKMLKGLVSGRVKVGEGLAGHSSFRIGGPADIWAEPGGIPELRTILRFAKKKNIPVFIIGNGSNILVSDRGFKGIVIRLASPSFQRISIKGKVVHVGGGFSLPRLVKAACDKGLGGMESLVGIPGTIGGSVYMNAGGWANPVYRNIGSFVQRLKVMDYNGKVRVLRKKDIAFGYRSSNLKKYIILEAELKLEKKPSRLLVSSLKRFLRIKRQKQALDMPSAGCVFKNPAGSQFTSGQMIDMLGMKGTRIGGAEISTKHANFIVNRDHATSKDVLALIEMTRQKVKANYNIPLEMEIEVIE